MVHSLHSWRFADRSLAVDTYPLLGECYHTSFNTANREQKWVGLRYLSASELNPLRLLASFAGHLRPEQHTQQTMPTTSGFGISSVRPS